MPSLTPFQLTIINKFLTGKTFALIAKESECSPSFIAKQMQTILKKLDILPYGSRTYLSAPLYREIKAKLIERGEFTYEQTT